MSGIYIHIPFCVEKCSYCNFYSSVDLSRKEVFIKALYREMELRKDYLNNQPADTLYFGGGTPSVLTPKEIEQIISSVKHIFGLKPNAEITLEVNPNNLDDEYFKQLTDTSINRLSIGIQSFFDDNLKILGRIHTAKQAEISLELADKYHFSNLSVDLMYGYPQLTEYQWKENLRRTKEIPHISCYSLSLESDSKLYKQVQDELLQLPDEEQLIEQYQQLTDFAKKNDFIHYETSNFCKPGCFSKHNAAYWQDKLYIGLGPAAHSFNHFQRQWNLPDIDNYIKQLSTIHTANEWNQKGEIILFEQEILTPTIRVNEYIMTSLRTTWGCDLDYVKTEFGGNFDSLLRQKIKKYNPQYYSLKRNKLVLTETGSLLADAIAGDLFF